MSLRRLVPVSASVASLLLGFVSALALTSCGGGGGGGGDSFDGTTDDPVVPLKGTSGTYSMTAEEANAANGDPSLGPPPFPTTVVNGQNQFIRLEFPFTVDASSIMRNDPLLAPFSYLTGNITINDDQGNHIPGVMAVNGRDVTGRDISQDPGWPQDLSAGGTDQNLGPGAVVYIAQEVFGADKEVDTDMATPAAFGGWAGTSPGVDSDSDGRGDTTDLKEMRISVNNVNGEQVNGFYTITFGSIDTTAPTVVSVQPTEQVPGLPRIDGKQSADISSDFVIEFSEPMVPQSVGLSAVLNGATFDGNLPAFTWPNPPSPPLPNTNVSSPTTAGTPVFIPFDLNPVATNNLSRYLLHPLITLPPNATIQVIIQDVNVNTKAAFDLHGNPLTSGKNFVKGVVTGDGPAIVNAPVSPEVVYWLPTAAQGMGAIDLNGFGFTTNTPNAHGDKSKNQFEQDPNQLIFTSIITRLGRPIEAGSYPGYNPINGRARDGINNQYSYPVGTGSQGLQYQTRKVDPGNPGNPGTPIPGLNEKSDGPNTFVKNSVGNMLLTGGAAGLIGTVSDCEIGDAIDRVFFDTLNFWAQNSASRVTVNALTVGLAGLQQNGIGDPPVPNPPPLRYNVGIQPIAFVLDNSNPDAPVGFVIEGEEVFGGLGNAAGGASPYSHIMLVPNQIDPKFGPDKPPPPYYDDGPPGQSATQGRVWAARQQIGNFLYVCDQTSKQLKVVNSNTFRVMTTIDLPDPWGVGIMPHLRQLYVSNFGDNSVSVVGTDPTQPGYNQELIRIPVGRGPRAVSCQVDGEDVLVANFVGNSIDIISPGTNTVRKSITALMNAPYDIVVTERQTAAYEGFGAGIYFAYISNFGSNNVVVFESGPDGPFGIGLDNVRGEIPTDANQDEIELIEPRGMTYDSSVNREGVYAGGCFVAHKDSNGRGVVSKMQFTHQPIFGPIIVVPPPGFFQPPGFSDRRFEVVSQWGTSNQALLSGFAPTDVAQADLRADDFQRLPTGGTNLGAILGTPGLYTGVPNSKHTWRLVPNPGTLLVPPGPARTIISDQLYISYADTGVIDIVDPEQGNVIKKKIQGNTTAVEKLVTFFGQ